MKHNQSNKQFYISEVLLKENVFIVSLFENLEKSNNVYIFSTFYVIIEQQKIPLLRVLVKLPFVLAKQILTILSEIKSMIFFL